MLRSAHDLADGGLAVALAESCIANRNSLIGASVVLDPAQLDLTHWLFSESQSRFLVSVAPQQAEALEDHFRAAELPLRYLGETGGNALKIEGAFDIPTSELAAIYYDTLSNLMDKNAGDR